TGEVSRLTDKPVDSLQQSAAFRPAVSACGISPGRPGSKQGKKGCVLPGRRARAADQTGGRERVPWYACGPQARRGCGSGAASKTARQEGAQRLDQRSSARRRRIIQTEPSHSLSSVRPDRACIALVTCQGASAAVSCHDETDRR